MKSFSPLLLLLFCLTAPIFADDCSNFDYINGCSGGQTEYPSDWDAKAFQTPPRGDPLWRESYQDMNVLVGYVRIIYNSDRTQATLNFTTKLNPRIFPASSNHTLYYVFGKTNQTSPIFTITKADLNDYSTLPAACYAYNSGGKLVASLVLDDLDFVWNHPAVNQPDNFLKGQKGAIVELAGWPYNDIAEECPALGKMGYLGVKVFPPQEAILTYNNTENGELNPWWYVYQPVSYRLHSRMGSYDELRAMINTCRAAGVRVYADAVVNHMTGNGNDMFPTHRVGSGGGCTTWGNKNGSAGSPWYTEGYQYQNVTWTNNYPGNEYPAVPYGPTDFHCQRALNSWTDPFTLNYGWLENLCDLNTEKDYVRTRIADYFTTLLSVGFSGFRIDAAKHISPSNLAAILGKFKQNLGGGDLPDDFMTYLEVIIGGEKDLLMCQSSSYQYSDYFNSAMKASGLSDNDIYKVKIWESDYPKEFPICGYWPIPAERYVAQNDCNDDQFPGSSSRDMGSTGSVLVKDKNVPYHRGFEVQLFTRTDGNWQIKLILSSYTFMESAGAFGYPDGKSDCSRCVNDACKTGCSKSMPYSKAHDPSVCGYTVGDNSSNWVGGVYTRVHRDMDIIIAMRKWMGLNSNVTPQDVGLPSQCQPTLDWGLSYQNHGKTRGFRHSESITK